MAEDVQFVVRIDRGGGLPLRYSPANQWHIAPEGGIRASDKPVPIVSADGQTVVGQAVPSPKLGGGFLLATVGPGVSRREAREKAEDSATLLRDQVVQRLHLDVEEVGGLEVINPCGVRDLWASQKYQPTDLDTRTLERLNDTPVKVVAGTVSALHLATLPHGSQRAHFAGDADPEARAQRAIDRSARRSLKKFFEIASAGDWYDDPSMAPGGHLVGAKGLRPQDFLKHS